MYAYVCVYMHVLALFMYIPIYIYIPSISTYSISPLYLFRSGDQRPQADWQGAAHLLRGLCAHVPGGSEELPQGHDHAGRHCRLVMGDVVYCGSSSSSSSV